MENELFIKKVDYIKRLRFCDQKVTSFDVAYMPSTLEEAYAIQQAVIAQLGLKVLGWKLGGTNAKTQQSFTCESGYLGPIFSLSDDEPAFIDSTAPRGEAELTFRLNEKIDDLNLKQIEKNPLFYFDAVYPSLELPYSKINNFHEVGMLPLIADLCGTGHLVVGNHHDLTALDDANLFDVRVNHQEVELAFGNSENLIGGYLTALSDFLKLVFAYDIKVESGQLVASGGITECIYLPVGETVTVDFGLLGVFDVCYP